MEVDRTASSCRAWRDAKVDDERAGEADERAGEPQPLARALFGRAPDAMLLADAGGRCLDANLAACALFQRGREQLIGRCAWGLAGYPHEHGTDDAFRWLQGRVPPRGTYSLERPDGSRRTLECNVVADVGPGVHLTVLRDVTEQLAAQEALRRNEARFRALIAKSGEIISLTAADGTTRYLTPLAWRALGWTPEELGARTLRDLVVPEDRARLEAELERLVRTGARDMSLEFRVRRRDGSIAWFESSGTNLLDDPDVAAIVGNYREITARKHAEGELRAGHDRLEEAQAIAHVGSFTCGVELDDTLQCTPELRRIFGVDAGARLTLRSLLSTLRPDDRDRASRAMQAAIERGEPIDLEYRVQRADDRPCWAHSRASVQPATDGNPARIVGTVQDVTDRHLAVQALEGSEERYRRIVEGTSEGVILYDAGSITTFLNARMAEMLGYPIGEAIGKPMLTFLHPADHAEGEARVARRKQGIAEHGEVRFLRKDGSVFWGSVRANGLFGPEGQFEAGLVLVTDVSVQRRADEVRAHLAAIVESSEDAILGVTVEGSVTNWNLAAERLYQFSASEMLGQSILRIVPPARLGEERGILDRVARGEAVDAYETERVRRDGSRVEVAVTVSPVRDASGRVIGISKIARDLTARRRAEAAQHRTEEQLLHAQKMEAVGRLAGGVAHDFNNLLSVIISYADLAVASLAPGDPMRADMQEIQRAGLRATELTGQLLAFSRKQVLHPRVIDLNRSLASMKRMVGRLLGEDVELTVKTGGDLGLVLADPGQIEQVVMNLAVNARDAMPGGGRLTIETANVELDADHVATHLGAVPGAHVMLSLSDTGHGMDAATRARIFEPFFTTKEPGKGTGLGLATVFGIVQQSGGHIGVESEPGRGATFRVYLPRTQQPAGASYYPQGLGTARGTETILLVEDEDQVRAVACAILRRSGYHVLDTSSGSDAFLIAKDFPSRIDLLLTDVVMPRMSGRQLAEDLSLQRPDMKVLFASGYADDVVVQHGVLEGDVAFLHKPFAAHPLLLKVREVLDGGTPVEGR